MIQIAPSVTVTFSVVGTPHSNVGQNYGDHYYYSFYDYDGSNCCCCGADFRENGFDPDTIVDSPARIDVIVVGRVVYPQW